MMNRLKSLATNMGTFLLSSHFLIICTVFSINILVQNWNLGLVILPGSDEGVYLYSAKLLGQGLIPYKDFFLAHPPYLLYITSIILWASNYNINVFHFVYTVVVFSSILPIYLTTYRFTNDKFASALSIVLFSTFPLFAELDAHFFALRQMSTPLLAFSILFLFRNNYKTAGLLLGFFSLSIFSNLAISLSLIGSFLFVQYILKKQEIKKTLEFIITFLLVAMPGYLVLFLIPNGFDNLIRYQLDRSFTPYISRIESIKLSIQSYNWPLLVFGLLGSILVLNKRYLTFGIFNLLSLLCIIFTGSSYFPHYLAILNVGLSISAGYLVSFIKDITSLKIIFSIILVIAIYKTSFQVLKSSLIDTKTPDFFHTSEILRYTPSPLFTYQPIYGLYNQKGLTFHYNVADMRYFMVVGKNLDKDTYADIINRSNTVLLTPSDYLFLPEEILIELDKHFKLIYDQNQNRIYIKK